MSGRLAAVREALDAATDAADTERIARRFTGARRAEVADILAGLAALGLALSLDTPEGRRWRAARGGGVPS